MASGKLDIVAERYLIQETIQTGGMTTVYLARDLVSDELIALKRFDRDKHLPEIEREAFLREVDALQNLKHPSIVRMLDSGEDAQGQFYVVLELMRHDLVHERHAGGAPFAGWDDFADLVVLPLVEALAYAHEMDIAHRDVKPANVLVDVDGSVKLADFGISKLKRTLQPRVTLNQFMSPPFSPPEADTGGYTYCRDVYSVGVLCIWGLCDIHVHGHASVLEGLKTFDAPPEVVDVIQRAVSTAPEDRQQSAVLLEAELSRIQLKRRRDWQAQDRPSCAVGLTNRAREAIAEEIATDDEHAIRKFVDEDMNADACIQRLIEKPGTMQERVRSGHYSLLGSSLRYHLAGSRGERRWIEAEEVFKRLHREFPDLMTYRDIGHSHEKRLICDDRFTFGGSFNLLSFSGERRGRGKLRHEGADLITSSEFCEELYSRYLKEFFS